MSKSFTLDSQFDPSKKAENVLDYVLDETSEITQSQKESEVPVDQELRREQLLKEESQRVQSRVLFITNDKTALEANSARQQSFKDLKDVFNEVHVMVLRIGNTQSKIQRIEKNVWVYPVYAKYFFRLSFVARHFAKQELQFTDGFRPDVIVACDPFESALAGLLIAKKFKRPFQVHITENFYEDGYKAKDDVNTKRIQIAGRILKKVVSIRVSTDAIKNEIQTRFPNIIDITLLPRFFHIQETVHRTQKQLKKDLYPQFAFTIVFIGILDTQSTLFRAIDAVRPLLRTPSIGFVIVGEGPQKEQFKERAKILGIETQVLFVPATTDLLPHIQSADILICTDTNSDSEASVITAAAAGVPIIASHTSLRDDLFTDGTDIFLCDPEDTICFSQKLTKFLNTNALRTQFSENARDIVQTRIEEDPLLYHMALRDSIEMVFYTEEEIRQKQEQEKREKVAKKVVSEELKEDKRKRKLKKKISTNGIEMNLPK